jgi:hypothetical protein
MSNGGGIMFSINNLTSIEFVKEEERGRPLIGRISFCFYLFEYDLV